MTRWPGTIAAILETGSARLTGLFDQALRPVPKTRPPATFPIHGLLANLLSTPEGEIKNLLAEARSLELNKEISLNLESALPPSLAGVRAPEGEWLSILQAIYVIIRIRRPRIVVETGTGIIGATSSFIAQGLQQNGEGHLWSVDPDKFYDVYGVHVGAGIPASLEGLITRVTATSRHGLLPLLESLRMVDIFVHDGLHTYRNMMFEFRTAWEFMNAGGLLLSDDINNCAIDRFCEIEQVPLLSVRYGRSAFGFVRHAAPAAQPRPATRTVNAAGTWGTPPAR